MVSFFGLVGWLDWFDGMRNGSRREEGGKGGREEYIHLRKSIPLEKIVPKEKKKKMIMII